MRFVNYNGQTIMLEDGLENVSDEIIAGIFSNETADNGPKLDRVDGSNELPVVQMNLEGNQSLGLFYMPEESAPQTTEAPLINVIDKTIPIQDENSCDLPEIGHLDDFTIPTAEDGTLLPATVNAKMADGSYQRLTLIPQIMDGSVTYSVQFDNLEQDAKCDILNITNCSTIVVGDGKEPNTEPENVSVNSVDVMDGYLGLETPTDIGRKIDSLISENESVISSTKKVMYGKRTREESASVDEVTKVKSRKVKFQVNDSPTVPKKAKLSLLKSNNEQSKQDTVSEMDKRFKLNSRLDYPDLTGLESPKQVSQVSPKKRPSSPVDCDIGLQQAKNLISLQKFLEKQELQLQIQPMFTNGGNNTKTKHSLDEQLKLLQDLGIKAAEPNPADIPGQEVKIAKDEGTSGVDGAQNDSKLDFLKYLKPSSEQGKEPNGKQSGIFIKNNPELFNGRASLTPQHPLGSCENPIQLVQTGQTFHSRQPLSQSQLRQIASILTKQKFDTPNMKRNSIYDAKTNTRIVYRVVYPEDVELKPPDEDQPLKKKRGRHRIRPLPEQAATTAASTDTRPPNGPRGPGRPRLKKLSPEEESNQAEDPPETAPPKKKIPRTRSGRLSRPPRYMVKDYKRLATNMVGEKNNGTAAGYGTDGGYSDYQEEEWPEGGSKEEELLPGLRPQQRNKRNFKPEYRCPTCHKIYLGHGKMMWHLTKFPEHCNLQKYEEVYKRASMENKRRERRIGLSNTSNKVKQMLSCLGKEELTSLCGPLLADTLTMWDFLLLRVGLLKQDSEVDALLQELSLLLEKLAKVAEDLLCPVFTKESNPDKNHYVEIDKMEIAIALGLPTGVYRVNNDNLNLLRMALSPTQEGTVREEVKKPAAEEEQADRIWTNGDKQESEETVERGERDGCDFWIEEKREWEEVATVTPLATKFEPNLSTKLMESSNDSIEDSKYEEPPLIDLDSNSKDNSSEMKEHSETCESVEVVKTAMPGDSDKGGVECTTTKPSPRVEETNEFLESFLSVRHEKTAKKEWLWEKEGDRLPCSRTTARLTSTPEVERTPFDLPNRRNSISDFSHISLDTDMVLPPAKTLIKDLVKKDEEQLAVWNPESSNNAEDAKLKTWNGEVSNSAEDLLKLKTWDSDSNASSVDLIKMKSWNADTNTEGLLKMKAWTSETSEKETWGAAAPTATEGLIKMKNWSAETAAGEDKLKPWPTAASDTDSQHLMNIALDSLTSNHVMSGPSSEFDILNQTQEPNLMFNSSEPDALDFNLPLPDHLLRTNFTTNNNFVSSNFQTTCTSNFNTSVSPTFISSSYPSTSEFEGFQNKDKDDVMKFFDDKMTNYDPSFTFETHSESLLEEEKKKKKKRLKPAVKKPKVKVKKEKGKVKVDYSKSSSIESIINEALFESGASPKLSSQSPSSSLPSSSPAFTLPIIPASLDDVGNLDFFTQD